MQSAPARPFISDHRLARFTTWAQLWLQAFALVLVALHAFNADEARSALRSMARVISRIIVLRAANHIVWPKRGRRKFGRLNRASLHRTFIGSALRKRLRGRNIYALFFALLAAMRDFDQLVARQAKRLANGPTRLCSRKPKRETMRPLFASFIAEPSHADSS